MPLVDTGYKHWGGRAKGIWYRRWVIAQNGLRASLASAWIKRLIAFSWISSLLMIAALFAVGQLIVPDSIILGLLEGVSPRLRVLTGGIANWLETNPGIAVHTTYNFLFYIYSTSLSGVCFVAIAVAIPHLITLDLQSRAILVYSSKALTRFDYFLGKLLAIVSLLAFVWLGPLLVSWFMGNALAPSWKYFIYSRTVLLNVLCHTGAGMLILGVLALGVSATSKKEKSATACWVALWLLGMGIAVLPLKPWLDHCSIGYNLDQLGVYFFNVKADLGMAVSAIGPLDRFIDAFLSRRGGPPMLLEDPHMTGVCVALGLLLVSSITILLTRVKPE
jgi:ABC-2 type transport system permease protein